MSASACDVCGSENLERGLRDAAGALERCRDCGRTRSEYRENLDRAMRRVRQSTASAICEFIAGFVRVQTEGRVVMTIEELEAMTEQILASARRIGGIDE